MTDANREAAPEPRPARSTRARSWPEEALATWAHRLVLLSAGVYILVVNRHAWFDGDEWDAIANRKLLGGGGAASIFAPHNEHFIAVPVLLYRVVFTFFGAHTYVPYIILVVVSHLLVVELLWLVLRRIDVDIWVALVATAGFAFLGVGWFNILLPFQIGFDLALAAGLAALLVVPDRGSWSRRDVAATILLVIGVACTDVALPLVGVVALVQLLRRGWRIALATLAAPTVVFLAWYARYHQQAHAPGAEPLRTAIQKLPAFVWAGLTQPFSSTLELSGSGRS